MSDHLEEDVDSVHRKYICTQHRRQGGGELGVYYSLPETQGIVLLSDNIGLFLLSVIGICRSGPGPGSWLGHCMCITFYRLLYISNTITMQ